MSSAPAVAWLKRRVPHYGLSVSNYQSCLSPVGPRSELISILATSQHDQLLSAHGSSPFALFPFAATGNLSAFWPFQAAGFSVVRPSTKLRRLYLSFFASNFRGSGHSLVF
ncbi:hypothetical protein I7I51_00824 [Histoplasma capsulatum]|uniref:Uncharacterized protein n=1 Tax=Ajellomyces capsulatus TaxID=5037 RepID=A0A8A1MGN6_AJECA|nr:hypothetical protein I7I51_00824 [Histoplasma capsulatum]